MNATESNQYWRLDQLYLVAAMKQASRALSTVTFNNPRVGCLLVNNGRVIGRGWHHGDGEAHAEVSALANAKDTVSGAMAYITMEPCCWHGRTPACTDALIDAGIRCVVVGEIDSHPNVRGRGLKLLESRGVHTRQVSIPGLDSLNPGHRKRLRVGLPWVRLKCGVSIDGRTAMANGESKWITGPLSRSDVQYWRARSAAIITGIGTVLADDPSLTVRDARFPHADPWRVVLDSRLRMPLTAKMLKGSGTTVIVCGSEASNPETTDRYKIWLQKEARVDLEELLVALANEGANEVLVEAGGTLTSAFIDAKLWDEMLIYVAPKFLGSTSKPMIDIQIDHLCDAVSGSIHSIEQLGDDVRYILRPT